MNDVVLETRDLRQALPAHAGHPVQEAGRRRPGGRRRQPRSCTGARRSAWSASPAAASPRWPGCWWAWRSRRAGSIVRTRQGHLELSPRSRSRRARRNIQLVMQDPYTSLNPRMTVGDIIGEPFEIHPDVVPQGRPAAAGARSCSTWSASTPTTSTATRTSSPAASGSASASPARWRSSPEIILCDEPVSALDVSIQAQVMNLLEELQDELGLSYIFIAHDLSVVRHIADRVAVMYLGKIVEIGTDDRDLRAPDAPVHPGAAVGGAGAGPDAARAAGPDRARGRRALAGEPALGLPLPHPVLEGAGDLRGARSRRWSSRRSLGTPQRLPLRRGARRDPRGARLGRKTSVTAEGLLG